MLGQMEKGRDEMHKFRGEILADDAVSRGGDGNGAELVRGGAREDLGDEVNVGGGEGGGGH